MGRVQQQAGLQQRRGSELTEAEKMNRQRRLNFKLIRYRCVRGIALPLREDPRYAFGHTGSSAMQVRLVLVSQSISL